ncbi:hypothetical protein BC830DRAFT_1140524 [Chytriomyces sp. MP71]|nr:hypothetical protein BC830DRAFT_1140524 [Chytriomyces sp. MP71]
MATLFRQLFSKQGMKRLLSEHGPAAMVTYSCVSVASIGLCYGGVRLYHQTNLSQLKDGLAEGIENMKVGIEHAVEEIEKAEVWVLESLHAAPSLARGGSVEGGQASAEGGNTATTLAAVWVAHNLVFPLRVGVTAVLTPYVASRLRGSKADLVLRRLMEASATKGDALRDSLVKMRGKWGK